MANTTLIEKWAPVLESDIAPPPNTTAIACITAIALEIQSIELLLSNRVPTDALEYSEYFTPVIRRLLPMIYNSPNPETTLDGILSLDDDKINRAIFTKTPNEIHAAMVPHLSMDLSALYAKYHIFHNSIGDSDRAFTLNLIMSKITNYIVEYKESHPGMHLWFIRAEMNPKIGTTEIILMGEP